VGIGNGVIFNTVNTFILISKHRLADFITVHISGEDTQDGQSKTVVVEIENAAIVKPFLCGYEPVGSPVFFIGCDGMGGDGMG